MALSKESFKLPELKLASTIGFQGKIQSGLCVHIDLSHIIYAVGQVIVIRNISDGTEEYLHGHSREISCLALSKDGAYIASGQVTHVGFNAEVIIWDYRMKKPHGSHLAHKVKVEAVTFSCESNFVLSLGGEDCGNIAVWNVITKEIVCRCISSSIIGGYATHIACGNFNNLMFVTAGRNSLQLWRIDTAAKKLEAKSVSLKNMSRDFLCVEIDPNDKFLYCGTSSGDILKFSLDMKVSENINRIYKITKGCPSPGKLDAENHLPFSPFYKLGVTSLRILKTRDMIIGTGEGLVLQCKEMEQLEGQPTLQKIGQSLPTYIEPIQQKTEIRLRELNCINLKSAITSLTLRGQGRQFFVGTSKCEIHRILSSEFTSECLYTCHNAPIRNISFPPTYSEIFATCSLNDIRLWNTESSKEIACISVSGTTCNCVFISKDGRYIISGWNDGKIRIHTPESAQFLYDIANAHSQGVTALAETSDSAQIISGGGDGKIRIWNANPNNQTLCATLNGHKTSVTCIKLQRDNKQCVSSGADGCCIIWDLLQFVTVQTISANTIFKSVCYDPEEEQIVTCGTDHKICFWDLSSGSLVRLVHGSETGAVNSLAISKDRRAFISGGYDKIVKFWDYDDAFVTFVGLGHSTEITSLAISPQMNYIATASKDGAIFVWKYPFPSEN